MGYKGQYIVPKVKLVLEFLEMFAIPRKRITFADQSYFVRVMIIPPNVNAHHQTENKKLMLFVRQCLLDVSGQLEGNKRVYVQRILRRKVRNES